MKPKRKLSLGQANANNYRRPTVKAVADTVNQKMTFLMDATDVVAALKEITLGKRHSIVDSTLFKFSSTTVNEDAITQTDFNGLYHDTIIDVKTNKEKVIKHRTKLKTTRFYTRFKNTSGYVLIEKHGISYYTSKTEPELLLHPKKDDKVLVTLFPTTSEPNRNAFLKLKTVQADGE